MKNLFILPFALSIIACGHVGNQVISDTALQKKAAFALSVDSSEVTISDREAGLQSIEFTATARGRKHQCYITTVMGAVSSDAICNNLTEAQKSGNCNALLKSANKC